MAVQHLVLITFIIGASLFISSSVKVAAEPVGSIHPTDNQLDYLDDKRSFGFRWGGSGGPGGKSGGKKLIGSIGGSVFTGGLGCLIFQNCWSSSSPDNNPPSPPPPSPVSVAVVEPISAQRSSDDQIAYADDKRGLRFGRGWFRFGRRGFGGPDFGLVGGSSGDCGILDVLYGKCGTRFSDDDNGYPTKPNPNSPPQGFN